MSNFQEAKLGLADLLGRGGGRGVEKRLSPGDLRAVCCVWDVDLVPLRGTRPLGTSGHIL